MNMNTEPIRLPAILVALLIIGGPALVAALLGQDWRVALAASVAALIPAGGVIGAAESRRARTDSPATVEARFRAAQARADAAAAPVFTELAVATGVEDFSTPPTYVDPAAIADLAASVAHLTNLVEAGTAAPPSA